jgi:hypothetical protein
VSLGFHTLWGAALFGLLVPVIVFYFLKLRRPRLNVPSLVLWRRVLEDRRVNSPFQRFKRNLLLFLQILALVAVVLAAMQPFWRGRERSIARRPVLVDCSASMAARDSDGVSRLDAAKEEVRKIIDGMAPGDELCLISFGRTARRRTGFTDNARVLAGALSALEVEDSPGDIEEALRLADAVSRTASFEEVLLVSDGNVPEEVALELPFAVDFRRLPPAGPNVGITALSARRSSGGAWDVFAMLEASRGARTAATLEVLDGDDEIATEHLTLGEEGWEEGGAPAKRVTVRVEGSKPSALTVRLVPDGPDSLACDNVAYLDLPAARRLGCFVPEGMTAFARALGVIEEVALSSERGAVHDLVVSDAEGDLAVEGRTRLFVGVVPEEIAGAVSVGEGGTSVVDWRRDHPLLAHVELADVVILDRPRMAEGAGEASLEALGYEVIAHGREGPLVLERAEGGRLSFFSLFHSDRSTLPYRLAFPILLKNLVDVAMQRSGIAEARAVRTGVLPAMELAPDTVCEVSGPAGKREEKTGAGGVLAGVAAPKVGRYRIACGRSVRSVGAGLLSTAETSLATVDGIRFREVAVSASSGPLRADKPFWYALALCAFSILLCEWWFFQRRPGGWA